MKKKQYKKPEADWASLLSVIDITDPNSIGGDGPGDDSTGIEQGDPPTGVNTGRP